MKELVPKISIEQQKALLERCIEQKTSLKDELDHLHINYDDLRYTTYNNNLTNGLTYETLDMLTVEQNNVPTVSFFAGAGGFDVGFEYAGFHNLATIEISEIFCNTLKFNNPNRVIIGKPDYSGDLKNREEIYAILKDKAQIPTPFEGIFHGGPPCQSFSIAANQRFSKNGDNFKRLGFEHSEYGNLLFDYVWYIQQFLPKVFIIENVPGLLEMDNGSQLNLALDILRSCGYQIAEPTVLNVADYGIPQNRNRLFVVGTREKNTFIFPKKNKFKMPCYVVFEKDLKDVSNNETREHKADSVIRYMELGAGKRDKLGRVDRLDPMQPSKTVIAGGVKGGGRSHLHPYIPRTLSAREAARLQTFPDNYIFTGPIARQFTQIGNAVPPLFAYKLAKEIYRQFYDNGLNKVEINEVVATKQLEMELLE